MTTELPSPEELDALEQRLRIGYADEDRVQAAAAIAALRAALDEANEARAKMLNTMVNALHDAPTSEEAEQVAAPDFIDRDKLEQHAGEGAAYIRQQAREIARLQERIEKLAKDYVDVSAACGYAEQRAERAEQDKIDLLNEACNQKNRAIAAEQERDALRADAERYRWLRGRLYAIDFAYGEERESIIAFKAPDQPIPIGHGPNLDAAIDAARGKDA